MTPEERTLADILEATFDRAHDPEYGSIRLRALLASITDVLEEAGRIENARVAYLRNDASKAVAECHGYACDTDDDVLALFYCIDATEAVPLGDAASIESVAKEEVDRAFRRLEAFVQQAGKGLLDDLDLSDPASELVALIKEALATGNAIELQVLTTGRVSEKAALFEARGGHAREVWDVVRLSRVSGGVDDAGIGIDFQQDHGQSLPCLVTSEASDGIQVLLTCIPANMLADIYNTHRGRLLERNVRSFLQFTGKVNKGIRETLLTEPSRFLAYNNGLSATAAGVELVEVEGDLARIKSVAEFQIVNGGQTTASVASCVRRDKADLSAVSIQMKLTVVPKMRLDELVPRISRFANTQNRIQEADFHANHPWHVELEKLSRSTWVGQSAAAPRGTRWFFERSRGQYADELAAAKTPAGRKKFRLENPSKQKFVKTDLAKYMLSWDQEPAVVSRGAQKCFVELMNRFGQQRRELPSQDEFKRIVAMAILFKAAERCYGELGHKGYRAQVVTYALARLSFAVGRHLPWAEIWEAQALPKEFAVALKRCLVGIRDTIVVPKGGGNVGEWCKKSECWARVREVRIDVDDLALPDAPTGSAVGVVSPTDLTPIVQALSRVPGATWFDLAKWAKQTDSLMPWQRSLAFSLGRIAATKKTPTQRQSVQGRILLLKACELGFSHPELTKDTLQLVENTSP